ncbi:MAG: BREX protein BrxB domain-containing protein [Opitutales bacterium]
MSVDMENRPVSEHFGHLLSLISSERFLTKQGLGNEVPFFICPYRPEEAVEMARMQKHLKNRLEQSSVGVLEVNLYDLAIQLLKDRGIWERLISMEESFSKGQLKELLTGVLDSESHLVPAMAQKMRAIDFDVMFITGVGEVFPYIRSHNVPASNGFCVYGGFPARDAAMSKLFSQLSWYRNPLKSSKGDTRSLAPQRVLEP